MRPQSVKLTRIDRCAAVRSSRGECGPRDDRARYAPLVPWIPYTLVHMALLYPLLGAPRRRHGARYRWYGARAHRRNDGFDSPKV